LAAVRHVLLVASTGGHLAQLLALRPWWKRHRRTWVTFDKADARSTLSGEHVVYAFHPTTRNIPNLLRNAWLALRIVPRERPDVVVTTGAGVAVPFFVVARVMRIPTVYLEVYDRVGSRTLTGRLCRPLATAFCVQWPDQQVLYPGSERVGTLL
jgi:UDP-N-acetylglucosamine:LPS N-acetylglucosamine transferase